MDYPTLFHSLSSQVHIAASAPIPFAVVVALVAAAVWRIMMWRYGGIIDGLEARIKQRDDEIAVLKGRILELSSAPKAILQPDGLSDKAHAIKQIESALIVTAGARAASQVHSGLLKAIPELHSAMLTAVKVYGLAKPPMRTENVRSLYALDLGKWLGEMLPLLKANHIDEARDRAKEMIGDLLTNQSRFFLT